MCSNLRKIVLALKFQANSTFLLKPLKKRFRSFHIVHKGQKTYAHIEKMMKENLRVARKYCQIFEGLSENFR